MARHRAHKEKLWTWPNAISLFRIPLGVGVAITGAYENWWWALAFLLVGALTDYLDGEVARRTGTVSKAGGEIDGWSDLALTAGAIAGLLFSGNLGWLVLGVAAVAYAILQWMRLLSGAETLRKIAEGVLPFYFLAALIGLIFWYAALAMSGVALAVFTAVLLAVLAPMAVFKRDRFKQWLGL